MFMVRKPVASSFWSFPMFRFPFSNFEEDEETWVQGYSEPSGLSVSEDEDNVYVEAAVPGLKPDDIEISYNQGILWIKGEKKEETDGKSKKFYRKAMSAFSYRVAIPGAIDESKPPEASYKHGMIHVAFAKAKLNQPKKIPIKSQ